MFNCDSPNGLVQDVAPQSDPVDAVVMRAKLRVSYVQDNRNKDGVVYSQTLNMHAVFNILDVNHEDNTYAKSTPGASFSAHIENPDLFGKFKFGDTFYVDFKRAE